MTVRARTMFCQPVGSSHAVSSFGTAAARSLIGYQKGRGFLWTEELSNLLAEYEAHRDQYPTLEAFAPRLVAFFRNYSKG